MSEPLVFMMGKFEAELPTDRQYAKNHMWARQVDGRWQCGFSSYAVRLLQDVYFLEWNVEAGVAIREKQQIGFIESSKAESDLYSPLTGTLTEFNAGLLTDPLLINVDKYDRGWLFSVEAEGNELLTPAEYLVHLESVWDVTQRTIKGQLNE